MNLDDDSQLSAFLDDELDPGDRLVVAWSVESSPFKTQQLAEIQANRGLIRKLGRPPSPIDLTAAICTEIALNTRARQRRSRKTGVARFAATLIGIASIAASLFLALTLLHKTLHEDRLPALFAIADGGPNPHRSHPLDTISQPPPAVASTQRFADRSQPQATPGEPTPPPPPPIVLADQAADRVSVAAPPTLRDPEPARPGQVDALLGHRKVFRTLIVTDAFDQTARQVRELIERDAVREPEFGRFTLPPGIVVDPDQPREAEVYSLVMDEPSVEPFVARLKQSFPTISVAAEADPALVTQLTEVGQAGVFTDVRPARLGSPPREIDTLVAHRQGGPDRPLITANGPGGDPLAAFPPARARTASRPDLVHRLAVAEGRAESAGPVTVLVWVTRSPRP